MTNLNKCLFALLVLVLITGHAGADDKLSAASPVASESQDNTAALVELAIKYEHAEGLPRDYTKAADLYCRAARSGNVNAQYSLGWMFANGRGVARNNSVAAQLFAMAAEQGHVHAREMLRYTQTSAPAPMPACLLPDKPATVAEAEFPEGLVPGDVAEVPYLKGPIYELVHRLAPRYEIDPKLVLAVIAVESGFNVRALSPKNAQGLMQLIPETARRFNVKNAFDPAENIKGGLSYLQWLLAFFKGNVSLVAAAYNSGEKTVERYRGIPPYPETQDYVRKITRLYKKPTHPYRASLVEASNMVALHVSHKK